MQDRQWDDQALNLSVFRIYNDARTILGQSLTTRSAKLCHRELTIAESDFLRNVNVYNLMQFLYFFKAYGITTGISIRSYIALTEMQLKTNRDIYEKMEADARAHWQDVGVKNKPRLRSARFPRGLWNPWEEREENTRRRREVENAIQNVVRNLEEGIAANGHLRFALADLQRFVIESMSEQTCTTTCEGLFSLRLISWRPQGQDVIIESEGILEDCFEYHLSLISGSLRQLFSATPPA